MIMKSQSRIATAALAGALFWNGADKAQSAPAAPETQENTGGIADIVVTAQKRSENLQTCLSRSLLFPRRRSRLQR